jgi:tetratricopeptide (TPR) repeat protein
LALESKKSRLEDPGAKLLDSLASSWNQYGRAVLIALGVVAAVAVGIVLTLRSRAAAEEQAAGRLAEASIFFWQGDYPRSLQMARQVAEQWPGAPSGIDAHRLAGDDQYWMGNFKEATAEYRRYLDHRKTGILADAVRRSLASSLESEHQFKEAAATYESLVGVFDRATSAEFLLAAARCYAQLHQPREAEQRIQRLLDEYGETPSANRGRIMRAELAAAPR